MQVSVETGEGLERRMTVQVSADVVEKQIEARLKSMLPRVKIDGFRPGKVPLSVVRRRYGSSVRNEVVGEVLESSFRDALSKENIKPAGRPTIEPKNLEAGAPLEYIATFEVYPEFELASLVGASLERVVAQLSDQDVDDMIEKLRSQRKDWVEVERASQQGDRVTVSFKGMIDGEAFEGGTAADVPVEIGSNAMIPGFEDQLVGHSSGDQVKVQVTFPDNYGAKELAGKEAEFETTINKIEEGVLPELDEDFVKSFGIEDANPETFRQKIRENMQRELKARTRDMLKTRAMDVLLDKNQIDVPGALVEMEAGRLRQMTASNYGQKAEALNLDDFKEHAKRRVTLGLIISEVVRSKGLKVDKDRVRKEIEDIASSYDEPEEVINHYYNNRQLLEGIESQVLEDMVVDWIVEQADVTDANKSFEEIMKPEARA